MRKIANRPGVRRVMPYSAGMEGVVTVQYPDDLGLGTYRDDKVWGTFYLRGDTDIVATRKSDGKKVNVTPTTAGANWKTLIKRLGDLPILTSDPSRVVQQPAAQPRAVPQASKEMPGVYQGVKLNIGEPQLEVSPDVAQKQVVPQPMKYEMQPVQYDPETGMPKPPELKMIKENSLKDLLKLANHLDNLGYAKLADELDSLVKQAQATSYKAEYDKILTN